MAGRNRDRQRAERRRALEQAVIEMQRRETRRRRLLFGGSIVLALAAFAAVVLLLRPGDGDESVSASRETTTSLAATTSTTVASAAGKPCVPVADPLPAGAPAVPVKVGPPPASLIKEDLKPGTGPEVKAGDTVTAQYIGVACSTGKIFDASYTRGEPATFPLSDVIPGWQQGIPGMKVGGRRLLGIPAAMAYGPAGRPPAILPDEALWFVVEITATKAQ